MNNDDIDIRQSDSNRWQENESIPNETLVPHSAQAEEAILGGIIGDGDLINKLTRLNDDDFFFLRHVKIWQAMKMMQEHGQYIDNLTLSDELEARKDLDDIGGDAYLTRLLTLSIGANLDAYAELLKRATLKRKLMSIGEEIMRMAQSNMLVHDAMNKALEILHNLSQENQPKSTIVNAVGAIQQVWDAAEFAYEHKKEPRGLRTGLTELDAMLNGGLKRGRLLVVGGRPGHGKTVLLTELARHGARDGANVAYFGLEMTTEESFRRIAASELAIASDRLERGDLTDSEWSRLATMIKTVETWSITFEDQSSLSIRQIETKCRALHAKKPLDLVLMDYAQLIDTPEFRSGNRVEAVGDISRRAKILCIELNCPVVLAAQVNRQCEDRADKRPLLSDLKESGSLEQDADIVIMVYDDSQYNENTEKPNQTELIIRKHRQGHTGVVRVYHSKPHNRLDDLEYHNLTGE